MHDFFRRFVVVDACIHTEWRRLVARQEKTSAHSKNGRTLSEEKVQRSGFCLLCNWEQCQISCQSKHSSLFLSELFEQISLFPLARDRSRLASAPYLPVNKTSIWCFLSRVGSIYKQVWDARLPFNVHNKSGAFWFIVHFTCLLWWAYCGFNRWGSEI